MKNLDKFFPNTVEEQLIIPYICYFLFKFSSYTLRQKKKKERKREKNNSLSCQDHSPSIPLSRYMSWNDQELWDRITQLSCTLCVSHSVSALSVFKCLRCVLFCTPWPSTTYYTLLNVVRISIVYIVLLYWGSLQKTIRFGILRFLRVILTTLDFFLYSLTLKPNSYVRYSPGIVCYGLQSTFIHILLVP